MGTIVTIAAFASMIRRLRQSLRLWDSLRQRTDKAVRSEPSLPGRMWSTLGLSLTKDCLEAWGQLSHSKCSIHTLLQGGQKSPKALNHQIKSLKAALTARARSIHLGLEPRGHPLCAINCCRSSELKTTSKGEDWQSWTGPTFQIIPKCNCTVWHRWWLAWQRIMNWNESAMRLRHDIEWHHKANDALILAMA